MRGDVIRQHQDRRLAMADHVAGDAVEKVGVHPVEIVQVLVDGGLIHLRMLGHILRRPAIAAVAVHDVRVFRPEADALTENGSLNPFRHALNQLPGKAAANAVAHDGELFHAQIVEQSQMRYQYYHFAQLIVLLMM